MTVARVALLCVLSGALVSIDARADSPSQSDVDAARTHYARGVQLYEGAKYEEALVELERANALAPTGRLLYNIALVQRQLGDVAGALGTFRSYLENGGDIPPARRTEVERAITELTAKVATVTITSTVAGVEITNDDRVVGTTPLAAPVRLNPGPHRIGASKAGYRSELRQIDVTGGDRAEIPFALEPTPSPPLEAPLEIVPPPAATPPEAVVPAPAPAEAVAPGPASVETRRPPTWIGWTVTGVLAAGAITTGIAALAESHTLSTEINDRATSGATIHSTHTTTTHLALASDILSGATAVGAAVTLYVEITSRRGAATSATHAVIGIGPGDVCLSTTF